MDFGYANPDAVDKVGVLPQYDKDHSMDAGWARSVIERWRTDYDGDIKWDSDEQKLVDWYEDDVIPKEKWDKIVEDYKAHETDTTGDDARVTWDEATDYKPPTDSGWTNPESSEYKGGNNANHELAVSTEAIDHIIAQIDTIASDGDTGMLLDLRKQLDGVQMRPGGFAKAEVMRQKINGVNTTDAGLRGDTMGLLLTLHEALFEIKNGLKEMKTEYEKAEEFNGMTAQQLGESMDAAWGKIGNISQYGNGSGTNEGGKA